MTVIKLRLPAIEAEGFCLDQEHYHDQSKWPEWAQACLHQADTPIPHLVDRENGALLKRDEYGNLWELRGHSAFYCIPVGTWLVRGPDRGVLGFGCSNPNYVSVFQIDPCERGYERADET